MPNLIATPRKWQNKTLLIKSETTYGTDPTPTGAANWIEARNVSLTPLDSDKVQRNIDLPYMGNSGNILVSNWAKLSFDIAMVPSGTAGTAPKWAPLLLGCGMAETITASTSAVYNLVSAAFGSVTGYMNIDGVLHKLLGKRGDVKGKIGAKGTPMLSFSFDAIYMTPVTGGLPTVTRTGWLLEEGVNSVNTTALTINGASLVLNSLDWSLGNKIARMDLPGPQREVAIIDRAPQASATVLAPDLTTFNPFALAEAGTTVALSNTHGSVAGKKVKIDMQVRIIGVDYEQVEETMAYKLTLDPIPVAGNDEIVLTCL